MKRLTFFLIITLFAGISTAGVKYVAVVETDVDAASGASADMNPAEVREITAELRRQATENLPLDRYSVMTSETVQSMGGAVLEECAEENCVIALGSKIGADYIVRGTISKFQTRFTLAVELYETENGTLVASSEAVRSENLGELLDKATVACANMYKKFVILQNSIRKPVTDTVSQQPKPKVKPMKVKPAPKPEPKERPPIKLSGGGGALFANDFGGGLKWNNDEQVSMPYLGGGAYLFIDIVYAEAFAGYAMVGGKWESDDVKFSVLPDMQRSYINIGAFSKYPITFENIKLFPLLGLDYEVSISATLNADGYDEYLFDGKDGNYGASALNALWFKFGGGIDAVLSQKLYIRAELLYGLRWANGFEKDEAKDENNVAESAKTAGGITLKVGVGINL